MASVHLVLGYWIPAGQQGKGGGQQAGVVVEEHLQYG